MHRVTGTFADPSHESAFAAQLFRMAYPTHVLLMALVLVYFTWNTLVQPEVRAYWAVLVLCDTVGLVCRVLLHRTSRHDPVRSQWIYRSQTNCECAKHQRTAYNKRSYKLVLRTR